MRIGIDCRLWNETGVGRYTRNLVVNLQKIDKKNEYILFVLNKDYSQIISHLSSFNSHLVKTDIRWHTIEEQIKFPQILNRENLDLVHFPYPSMPIFYNRPFVITIHDLIPYHYPTGKASTLPSPLYHIKRIGYRKVLGNAVSKAKKIIVPLLCVKEDLVSTLKVPKDKISITNEGFDPNIKKGKVSENVYKASKNPYFMYVGNAYPHKNLENLIKAFDSCHPELVSGSTKVKLILVGKEDYFYKKLEAMKNNNLIFLHAVSDSDLFYLYAHSIAAVSASLMEGFGLLPLEALGAGTVPVVSDISSFREVCGNLAIYFNPKDPNDIAGKLIQALSLKDSEREEIRAKAKAWLKKFSWQKMAKKTLAVYEQAAS